MACRFSLREGPRLSFHVHVAHSRPLPSQVAFRYVVKVLYSQIVCSCHLANWSSLCLVFSSKQLSGGVFGRPTFTPRVFFFGCWRLELSCEGLMGRSLYMVQDSIKCNQLFLPGQKSCSASSTGYPVRWSSLNRSTCWPFFLKIFQRLDIFPLNIFLLIYLLVSFLARNYKNHAQSEHNTRISWKKSNCLLQSLDHLFLSVLRKGFLLCFILRSAITKIHVQCKKTTCLLQALLLLPADFRWDLEPDGFLGIVGTMQIEERKWWIDFLLQ